MKRIFAVVMSCIMVMGNLSTALAMTKEKDMKYQEIIQQLETTPELYGGLYFDDDVLHVIPLENEQNTYSITTLNEDEDSNIIIDEPQAYSLQELNQAFETLRANRNSLGVTGYSIDILNNGIKVMAKEWNDEKKRNIQELINIENIDYVLDKGSINNNENISDKDNVKKEESTEKLGKRYTEEVVIGSELEDRDKTEDSATLKCTLGAGVITSSGNYGVVTTGHGMEKSDRIYVGGDYLGKVVAQKMKDNADISIIEIPSRSNFVPSCFTNTGDFVGYYSLPVVGHGVRIFSKDKRKNIYGRITEFRADIFWDDKKYNDKNWYFDMVGFQVISDNVMEGGDSGSAVAKVYEDDEYALCSIYKGQKEYDYGNRKELWGYATRWDTVEKEFDVSLCEGE